MHDIVIRKVLQYEPNFFTQSNNYFESEKVFTLRMHWMLYHSNLIFIIINIYYYKYFLHYHLIRYFYL